MRIAVIAAALAWPGLLPGQAIAPVPLRHAEVTFAMRATKVNDFVGRVDTVQAHFSGSDLTNVTGVVEFQVRDMHTGIGLRDTHMRNAMRADSFPTIRFELIGVDPGTPIHDSLPTVFQGHLTIHGVTRTVRVPGTLVLRQGAVEAHVSFPLDMREYGIEPPTRFLGAVKVDPVTTVGVHLVFGP